MSMQMIVNRSEHPRTDAERAEILANPGFGTYFTDHMFIVEWTPDAGWHNARVEAYGPLTLDPATAVLHYAQEAFEGMKAYRHADGSIWTFRPEENAARMARSCRRLALPELPIDDFVADHDGFGADVVVITSASAKTAIATAHQMRRRGAQQERTSRPGRHHRRLDAEELGDLLADLVLEFHQIDEAPGGVGPGRDHLRRHHRAGDEPAVPIAPHADHALGDPVVLDQADRELHRVFGRGDSRRRRGSAAGFEVVGLVGHAESVGV